MTREVKRCVCLAGDAIAFHGLVFFCHARLLADGNVNAAVDSRGQSFFRSYLRVFLSPVLRSLSVRVTRFHVRLRPRSPGCHFRDPSLQIRNHEICRFLCPLQLGQIRSSHGLQKVVQVRRQQCSRGDFLHISSIYSPTHEESLCTRISVRRSPACTCLVPPTPCQQVMCLEMSADELARD